MLCGCDFRVSPTAHAKHLTIPVKWQAEVALHR